jgi:hypothetical protein
MQTAIAATARSEPRKPRTNVGPGSISPADVLDERRNEQRDEQGSCQQLVVDEARQRVDALIGVAGNVAPRTAPMATTRARPVTRLISVHADPVSEFRTSPVNGLELRFLAGVVRSRRRLLRQHSCSCWRRYGQSPRRPRRSSTPGAPTMTHPRKRPTVPLTGRLGPS